jgi:mannose/cellobiose epimerase-like protein (N-acyl-D-glucosamine 2-epimerase family)
MAGNSDGILLSDWLTQSLLPGWLARACDPARPGFVEMLAADGTIIDSDERSTLVTARLIYVFSHAHLMGVPGALAAAKHGVDFLMTRCRRGDGRFSHRCLTDGTPVDARSDFYDLAFVLFSLGWYGRASGDRSAFAQAEEVMGFLESDLAHSACGFAEDTLGTLPRRQNPHMHLLEACHALAQASGEARWLDRAEALVGLMRTRMRDEGGALAEFFTADWRLAEGPHGLIREPGHHYEWVWLLLHHARLTGGTAARETAGELFAFAGRHRGAPAHGCIVNEIGPDGTVLDGRALLWPQTEYLKALVARIEFEEDADAEAELTRHLALMFARFVDRDTGLWINQIDAEGRPVPGPIPVRVLYHLVLACAEIVRVRPGMKMP